MNALLKTAPAPVDLTTPLKSVVERSQRDKEAWHYTNLTTLLASPRQVAPALAGRPDMLMDVAPHQHRFVFVNGTWTPERSNFGDLPRGMLQDDGAHGYRLSVADQACLVTTPIELLFLTDSLATDIGVRFVIDVGSSASLTLIERHQGHRTPSRSVIDMSIRLAPQAKLIHNKILQDLEAAVHLAATSVDISDGAYYQNFALLKDVSLARNEMHIKLNGPLAQCTLNGVMLIKGREHIDSLTETLHKSPNGSSRQLYKTIIDEAGHGVFQGKIIVAEGAQKTDGRQLSRALLLSDQAEMDAKPELQIFADDVSCSHGSTVGDLDIDTLFYLRARGLSESEARALLLHAFVLDVIDEIPPGDAKNEILAETERWFHVRS